MGAGGFRWRLAGIVLLATAALTGQAQAADVFAGSRIYDRHCEQCHGPDGRGLAAGTPDFQAGAALMQPDLTIYRTVSGGKGGMPSFRGILDEQEILDVIAYLRTLQR